MYDKVYSIFDVAEWFLQKQPMTHKKLQKLCYYAQAWSYTLLDRPICDSIFEAWVHGPVSPELYEKYAGSGWNDIVAEERKLNFDRKSEELLESVYSTYGNISGNELEALTHSELPWLNARGNLGIYEISNNPISPEDMKKYYKTIYIGGEE